MKKMISHILALAFANCISLIAFSQNSTITGTVSNSTTKEKVGAVSVLVKGSSDGTFTDDKGSFKLTVHKALPVTLIFSSIGYELQEMTVNSASEPIKIDFKPASSLGQEVVVAASRVPERILVSPVSIERINPSMIRNSPASDYYDIVKTLKGVDVTNSSLTFTSITTRGFNGSGNPRFNQFLDGMDNQAPGLNFSVGSVIGPSQLDVDNMELLPGASSALYGSGGMNGTLLITSKDPFKYQGLSGEVKLGTMHLGKSAVDPVGASQYFNVSLRYGKQVSDKFAFKIGGEVIDAKDWVANDSTNYTGAGTGSANHTIPGSRSSDPNYNGVNTYGDDINVGMQDVANQVIALGTQQFIAGYEAQSGGTPPSQSQINSFLSTNSQTAPFYNGLQAGFIPNQKVSRTGYAESQIIDPTTYIIKLNGGLYYKINSKTEASAIAYYGTGNTVYTGSDRYSLKNLKIGQYKLEVKNDNWFIKAYTTQENSGDAFNATVSTDLFDEAWKPSTTWFPEYVGAYVQARSLGADSVSAYALARAYADRNRPAAGSAQFKNIFDSVSNIPIPKGGKFLDRTDLYHAEGQYNLTPCIKVLDVLVGASYRLYRLNSQGTLFADTTGPINTSEYGAYIQLSKKLLEDKLKLTASGRYDKNQNFKGKFTPRVSAVYEVAPDQYIRGSYQTAYRFPSNQNQWINLNTGTGILIGGLPTLRHFYNIDDPVNPLNHLYTVASVIAFQQGGGTDPSVLVEEKFGEYKPETVQSAELGYKGIFNKRLLLDVYGYYSWYKDFIGRVQGIQLATERGFSVSVNSSNRVKTYGGGISISYLLPHNFVLDGNFSTDNINNPDPTFATYWNTPLYRTNIGIGNSGFGYHKRFGVNAQYRWQDSYYTESDFLQGNVPAFSTVDLLVSYKLPAIQSLIKIGANNLFNHYYRTAFANPSIGGLYYVSFAYNVF